MAKKNMGREKATGFVVLVGVVLLIGAAGGSDCGSTYAPVLGIVGVVLMAVGVLWGLKQ